MFWSKAPRLFCLYLLMFPLVSKSVLAQEQKAPAPAKLDEASGFVIPIEYDPFLTPLPVVYLRINGAEPMAFQVDTGTRFALMLQRWAADKLHLKITGDATSYGKKIGSIAPLQSTEYVFAPTSKTFHMELTPCEALVVDTNFDLFQGAGKKLAGILGIGMLSAMTVRFDFVAKTMTCFADSHPLLDIPGAARLDLQQPALKSDDARYITEVVFPGQKKIWMLLDTGATNTSIPKSVSASVKPLASDTGKINLAEIRDDGNAKIYPYDVFFLPLLRLGDFQEPNVVLTAKNDLPTLGGFGMDIFSRFRLTLDFPNHAMYLERAKDYAERSRPPGDAGFTLEPRPTGYYVGSVKRRSAADKAGLREEDRISSIDGRRLLGLPENSVKHLLDGYAGAAIELRVTRAGTGAEETALTISYERGSLFRTTKKKP